MTEVHDIIGVGLGPFNLGLAALNDGLDDPLDAVFLEQKSEFNWHEGMLIEGATLEVPFLADMVTMSDPSNRYSYLNYLRENDRLYEFYFYEEFFIPRKEYNDYCRWVADLVSGLQFNQRVTEIHEEDGIFRVTSTHPETGTEREYYANHIVTGIGSQPNIPDCFSGHRSEDVFHTASYMHRRDRCLEADSITVVGSGQSAAEVFRDLLERQPEMDYQLDWLTRSRGFFQMIDGKLGHMIYTPDYTEYFYNLNRETKDELLGQQDLLYKGIDKLTSRRIYDALYEQSIGDSNPDVRMMASTSVNEIEEVSNGGETRYRLQCEQWQQEKEFKHETEVVILGTGYERPEPTFLDPIADRLKRDDENRLSVSEDFRLKVDRLPGEIFVQNAELHTHGINAPDLGMGCYRNAVILNTLLGEEVYPAGRSTTFQDFSVENFQRDQETEQSVENMAGGI